MNFLYPGLPCGNVLKVCKGVRQLYKLTRVKCVDTLLEFTHGKVHHTLSLRKTTLFTYKHTN